MFEYQYAPLFYFERNLNKNHSTRKTKTNHFCLCCEICLCDQNLYIYIIYIPNSISEIYQGLQYLLSSQSIIERLLKELLLCWISVPSIMLLVSVNIHRIFAVVMPRYGNKFICYGMEGNGREYILIWLTRVCIQIKHIYVYIYICITDSFVRNCDIINNVSNKKYTLVQRINTRHFQNVRGQTGRFKCSRIRLNRCRFEYWNSDLLTTPVISTTYILFPWWHENWKLMKIVSQILLLFADIRCQVLKNRKWRKPSLRTAYRWRPGDV